MILSSVSANSRRGKGKKKTKQERVRVFIVDSFQIYQEGLIHSLEKEKKLEVVSYAASVDEIPGGSPTDSDVLILDMDRNMVQNLHRLHEIAQSLNYAVLPLSYQERDIDLVTAYSLGCAGWLLRSLDPASLIRSIRYAPSGPVYTADQMRRILNWKNLYGSQLMNLKDRELEVLWLVLQGKNNTEIAKTFSLAENTVEKHIGSLLQRFGQTSRISFIPFFFNNHLDALQYYPAEIFKLVVGS